MGEESETDQERRQLPLPACPNDGQPMSVTKLLFGFYSVSCWKCGEWSIGRFEIQKDIQP